MTDDPSGEPTGDGAPRPVHVPTTDVNSEYGVLVHWHRADRATVSGDEPLADVETSKALIEVTVPGPGVLLHLARENQELPLTEPVALLFPDEQALQAYEARRDAGPADGGHGSGDDSAGSTIEAGDGVPFASTKAIARAAELGVDLATLDQERLITVADVERAAADPAANPAAEPRAEAAHPLLPHPAHPGMQRLLVIGGGRGAAVLLDLLLTSSTQVATAILDDDRGKWGAHISGVPIVGGIDRIAEVAASGAVDAAVIPITAAAALRAGWRAACTAAGLPLANVIAPSARIGSDVVMGGGNIVCAQCNIGTGTRIGDNNFLSAYTSLDHHNTVGSELATGPGCMTSGSVTIGNGVTLGTGVFIEPGVTLDDGVQVASGAVILTSVPPHHAVKTRTFTTTVVPLRR